MIDFKYDIESGNLFLLDSDRLESLVKNILKKGFKIGDHSIYLRPTYIDMDGNPIQNAGNIYPKTSGTYSLGSSTYKWLNAFLSGYADIGSLRIGGTEVIDSTRRLKNILTIVTTGEPSQFYCGAHPIKIGKFETIDEEGRAGNYPAIWADLVLRIAQRVEVWGSPDGHYLDVRNSDGTKTIVLRGDTGQILPGANNAYNIGSSSYKWKDGYFAGAIDLGSLKVAGTEVLTSGRILQNIVSVAQTLLPDADNSRDLGSSSYRWKDLYVGGRAFLDHVVGFGFIHDMLSCVAGKNDLWNASLDSGSEYVDDVEANFGRAFTYWEGWTGSLSIRNMEGFMTGRKYMLLLRAKMSGSLGDARILIYNWTDATTEFSVDILNKLTTSYQIIDAGIVNADWDPEDDVRFHFGSNATNNDDGFHGGDDPEYIPGRVYIDWLVMIPIPSYSLIPSRDNAYDLGSSSYKWKDLYLAGIGDLGSLKIGGTEVIDASKILKNIASFAQDLIPDVDASRDLGSASYRWQDLRLSRDIYIGGDAFISGILDNPYIDAYSSDYGLVLYLPFEEGTGTSVYDESPYGNDGTVYGTLSGTVYGASWVDGKYGKALSFDVSDYVKVPHDDSLDLSAEFTISAWFKTTVVSGYRGLVSYDDETVDNNISYMIYLPNSNAIRGRIADGSASKYVTVSGTSDGEWHHVVFVVTSDQILLYVDGSLGDSTPRTINPRISPDNTLKVGRYRTMDSWDGLIDEVRIYNRVLNEEEIQQLYQGEDVGGGRVLCLRFDEGEGTTVYSDNWCDGKFGKALSFDGKNDQLECSPSSSLDFGTNSFTVIGWFYHRDYTYPKTTCCIWHGNAHGGVNPHPGFQIGHGYVSNGIKCAIRDVEGNTVFDVVPCDVGSRPLDWRNKWVHIAVVFNRALGQCYAFIDGVQQSGYLDISSVTGSIDNNLKLVVGNCVGWRLDGVADDIRIYNRALTEEEIRALYLAGKSRYSRSIVVSDKFRILNTSLSELLRLTTTNLNLNVSLLPSTDNTYDLGTSTYRWKDLFLAGQAIGLRLENRTSDPSSPAEGQIWIRTDL